MKIGKLDFTLNRNETILVTATILSLFFLFSHYLRAPQNQKLLILKQEVDTAKSEVETNEQLLARLSTGVSRGPASIEDPFARQRLEKYAQSNDRLSKIMQHLAKNKEHTLVISRISTEKPTALSGYTKTRISLDAEASFVSIGKFLEKIEDSPLLTEVESIEINRVVGDLRLCNAKINLFSYVTGP